MDNELTKEMIMNAISELRKRARPFCLDGRELWVIRCNPTQARRLVKIIEESPEDIPLLIEVVK